MDERSPRAPRAWHLVTGEFPPQPGGVSDYTQRLARSLAAAGFAVHVWAPPADPGPEMPGVTVHRLEGRFGLRDLRALRVGIDSAPGQARLFVQYVAGAFGWRAMNLPFCLWLFARRSEPVWVMFHEYAYPIGWKLNPWHNLLGCVTSIMGGLVAARADRIFVSTPAWEPRIPRFVRRGKPVTWLPVPSNIPDAVDMTRVSETRARLTGGRPALLVGHFGTYGPAIADLLVAILPGIIDTDPSVRLVLMGRNSDRFAATMPAGPGDRRDRVVVAGSMPPDRMAEHLAACDLLVQPYPDGVTSRRSSLMAGLALGKPVVTNAGPLTEPIWRDSQAVALAAGPSAPQVIALTRSLLNDATTRDSFAARASALYTARFTLERTIELLREAASREQSIDAGGADSL